MAVIAYPVSPTVRKRQPRVRIPHVDELHYTEALAGSPQLIIDDVPQIQDSDDEAQFTCSLIDRVGKVYASLGLRFELPPQEHAATMAPQIYLHSLGVEHLPLGDRKADGTRDLVALAGRGYGSRLLREVLERYGSYGIWLYTSRTNRPSYPNRNTKGIHDWYRDLGFVCIENDGWMSTWVYFPCCVLKDQP